MANFDEYFLMKDLSKDLFNPLSGEDFVQMFDANYGSQETLQGYATKGTVKDIRGDFAMVDVGLKSEGRVPLKEFGASVPSVGDIIDVFVERYESREGTAVLSYAKARAEKAWKDLEKTVAEGVDPEGTIIDVDRHIGFARPICACPLVGSYDICLAACGACVGNVEVIEISRYTAGVITNPDNRSATCYHDITTVDIIGGSIGIGTAYEGCKQII